MSKLFLCLLMNLLAIVLGISSPSFLLLWVSMEISSFFFIPMILSLNKVPFIQSMWKYYLSQIIGSFLMFYSMNIMMLESEIDKLIFLVSIFMKMGSHPFMGWLMNMSESMDWLSFYLLGSMQKIIPLFILSELSKEMSWLISLSSISGMILLILFFFLKKTTHMMMMISSLLNLNWLILASSVSKSSLIYFILTYFFLLLSVISFFSKSWKNNYLSFFKSNISEKFLSNFMFLFFIGIPPFGTFLAKLELILDMMSMSENMFFPLILIFISSVSGFMYLKFVYSISLFFSEKSLDHFEKSSFSFYFIFFLYILFLLWMLI